MASVKTWIYDLRDFLLPRRCAVCGCALSTSEQVLCSACLVALPYLPMTDFRDNQENRLFWGKIPVERAHSYLSYRHGSPSHRLLMQLKYNHRPDLARWFGRQMARDLKRRRFFEGVDCIVPVPLHWLRRLQRGYNQSLMLAKGISEVSTLPVVENCVRRICNNPTQTNRSASERIVNVEDVFSAMPNLPYHHVLLVDDVLTTGATLTSCAKAIQRQNPDVVFSILTLAKA